MFCFSEKEKEKPQADATPTQTEGQSSSTAVHTTPPIQVYSESSQMITAGLGSVGKVLFWSL